jgi:hypothetical protein
MCIFHLECCLDARVNETKFVTHVITCGKNRKKLPKGAMRDLQKPMSLLPQLETGNYHAQTADFACGYPHH